MFGNKSAMCCSRQQTKIAVNVTYVCGNKILWMGHREEIVDDEPNPRQVVIAHPQKERNTNGVIEHLGNQDRVPLSDPHRPALDLGKPSDFLGCVCTAFSEQP